MSVRTDRMEWKALPVGEVAPDVTLLPPVCLVGHAGAATVQDYLTSEQARTLAHELLQAAASVE